MVYRHSQCEQSCQFVLSQNRLAEATNIIRKAAELTEGIAKVSNALWCDRKQHAFSDRDSKRRHFTETEVDDRGNSRTVVYDFCGECASEFMNGGMGELQSASQD